jgi:hypothetical protein
MIDMDKKSLVTYKKGKIFFKGELINQLISNGFTAQTCYSTDKPDDMRTFISSCTESEWFRIFTITFMAYKDPPYLLISPKVNIGEFE